MDDTGQCCEYCQQKYVCVCVCVWSRLISNLLLKRYWTDTKFKIKMLFKISKTVDGADVNMNDSTDLVAPINNFLNS